MKVDRVTREMVRAIKPFETVEYTLPTVKACFTAATVVSNIRTLDGYQLELKSDRASRTVRIFRRS